VTGGILAHTKPRVHGFVDRAAEAGRAIGYRRRARARPAAPEKAHPETAKPRHFRDEASMI